MHPHEYDKTVRLRIVNGASIFSPRKTSLGVELRPSRGPSSSISVDQYPNVVEICERRKSRFPANEYRPVVLGVINHHSSASRWRRTRSSVRKYLRPGGRA